MSLSWVVFVQVWLCTINRTSIITYLSISALRICEQKSPDELVYLQCWNVQYNKINVLSTHLVTPFLHKNIDSSFTNLWLLFLKVTDWAKILHQVWLWPWPLTKWPKKIWAIYCLMFQLWFINLRGMFWELLPW